MKIDDVRRLALSLPQATEQPHFDFASFRVNGKIFATLPPSGDRLHVFVEEWQREMLTAGNPETYEKLMWGKKAVGLRVNLAAAKEADVERLLRSAWERKAPKSLLRTSGG